MQNVYTVAQVNSYIKNMFSQDYMMRQIMVRGEVSNCKYHSSGHIYFTLKDRTGTIACVMFAGSRSGLAFRMEAGQQVIVGGSIEVYERDGKYQLYAKQIFLDGAGDLNARFEQLKKELQSRGMFDSCYKMPIPKYIKTLGVVTAQTGAAIRDIINIASRRNPYVQIVLYPAIVQGEMAAASIVNGIHALETLGVDTMIVGRGGGSLEDLWAFNEEIVAQAIFDCSIPVISAVGHETDTTISDYVADLRAPTPSAAAELAVADIQEVFQSFAEYRDDMTRSMTRRIRQARLELENRQAKIGYLSPSYRIREMKTHAMHLEEKLSAVMQRKLQLERQRLELYVQKMKGVSPLDKLNQGYSYTAAQDGKTLSSIKQLKEGDLITVYVRDGQASARVEKTIAREERENI